jgi:hypothetical protein
MPYVIIVIVAIAAAAYWRYRSKVAKEASTLRAAAKAEVVAVENSVSPAFEAVKAKLDELLGDGPKGN